MPASAYRAKTPTLEPKLKVWVERNGKAVLGDGRVDLLVAIAEAGSLVEAAETMNLSYRRAWGKLREMERALGESLVVREKGGSGRGGSRLTPLGEQLVKRYNRFRTRMERDLEKEFNGVFSG